jgi:hypothetical protein
VSNALRPEAPKSKIQRNSNAEIFKQATGATQPPPLVLDHWDLKIPWNLELGIWNFRLGVAPGLQADTKR